MVIGFVLINCESNYQDYVMDKLNEIKGVSEYVMYLELLIL